MAGIAAVIVAAGRGSRFGGDVPKQYLPLGGKPLLRWTLERFAHHRLIDVIQPVIDPADADRFAGVAAGIETRAPVAGGATRQESVRRALEALVDVAPEHV
ncbi:MAG: bifunctional 2-C-methyl-D-erythritol 4-phosphate cytidylyltransferase/2-C-methyl-D-erythritol 2,4-cyclodiphosphate synthase, partial [Alphaproteobacteria bacterium]|nr:bifunctional 2-C-methyl-D-erythritol 4-phosphate cytidylyltransferase/2-C-methyl-D-erythritol 2,4-cyclodiphosphate synthase [Alphaproteobacteria bacterium]